MTVDHLFVYGTLRRGSGHAMHETLAAAARLVGGATTAGRIVRIDWYPGLVLDDPAQRVVGELWRLHDASALAALDDYEGPEFERRAIAALTDDGRTLSAWAWVFVAPAFGLPTIESGDWFAGDR